MPEPLPREITQRELRNDSGAIMRGVERGESFTITRNGTRSADSSPCADAPSSPVKKSWPSSPPPPASTLTVCIATSTPSPSRIPPTVRGDLRNRGLLDTTILIHLTTLDPARLPDEMIISAVTLAELSASPHTTDDAAERARRTSLLQHTEATFDPLPFDADAARRYGMISAAVHAARRTPHRRVADLMIASIAAVNRLPLYTTNPTDPHGLDDPVTVVAIPRPEPTRP